MTIHFHFPDRVVGSTHEPFVVQLTDVGVPANLLGVTGTFRMVTVDGVTEKVSDAVIEDPLGDGQAVYLPVAADVDTAGNYWCEVTLTFPDTTVYRSPRIGQVIKERVEPTPP